MFTGRPLETTDTDDQAWYIQDTVTSESAILPMIPDGDGPYRARLIDSSSLYEVAIVAGTEAWRITSVNLDHVALGKPSVDAVQRLHLSFAAVFWSISKDMTAANMVRIDAFPQMEHLVHVWPEVSKALVEILFA